MLRFETAGESHGECLLATLTGLPAGVPVSIDAVNHELWRRQQGYGRGGRMKIETDCAEIVAGVRHSKTIGSPVGIIIRNKDWQNWTEALPVEDSEGAEDKKKPLTRPRPGHADLAGAIKYNFQDARYILERASARETTARVDVVALGVPPGLGSHATWDTRLDGKLAQAIVSMQAVKGVEVGFAEEGAASFGSKVQDTIHYQREERRFTRGANRAGGIEGGMTNGQDVVVRGLLKPISTLRRPLESVDLETREPALAAYERSDVCVVPAAGVIGEAMVGLVLAQAFLEKFGGDSLTETRRNFDGFIEQVKNF